MTINPSTSSVDGTPAETPPVRFQTARSTLFIDRLMKRLIEFGGILVIAAVLGVFLFIFFQVFPLFQGAHVDKKNTIQLPPRDYQTIGIDPWAELPFLIDREGTIAFVDVTAGREAKRFTSVLGNQHRISAVYYDAGRQTIVFGTDTGAFSLIRVRYERAFDDDTRSVRADLEAGPAYPIGTPGFEIQEIAYGEGRGKLLVAALQKGAEASGVYVVRMVKRETLLASGAPEIEQQYDLTDFISGTPERVLVNSQGDGVVVATKEGKIFFFHEEDGEMELRQEFAPFQDQADPKISSIHFLLGGVTLVLTNPDGTNRMFSLYVPSGSDTRLFGLTKEFAALPGPALFYDASLRNKAFLIGTADYASIRYGTTASIRWEARLPFKARLAILGQKYRHILFLDQDKRLHVYHLNDPHPEAGFDAFFRKIWYEGYPKPVAEWQSSGATDDFESKLSLVPLIIGTLKGTFYAMLFALPVAFLSAMYTAEFAHPKLRGVIKPTMEMMASLPSVVLGFLAALWLAPILETRTASILLILLLLPASALAFGYVFTSTSASKLRIASKPGYEWLLLIPVMIAVVMFGWVLGPAIERLLFVVHDSNTGQAIADFRLWWLRTIGAPFEQRNSLVVGFMMGFAVIPIIFSIAEDSLSSVPKALRSASLALGASRWQTAMWVVLPTAFPGIFSAIMIGLGRAVGETMIVLMATGNTPIMDFNIFSGMRTLAANIAVELPEAPHESTLYRTLFLGALLLFLMTFVVNTLAEAIRQRMRVKYRTA